MKRVILDTNMLLVPGQFKVDIFSELERVLDDSYEIVILEGTLVELERIAQTASGEDKRAARLAQMLLEHERKKPRAGKCKGLKTVPSSNPHVDDAILEIAEDDCFVATNDQALKRRLLEKGVRVVYLKQRQHLAL